MVDLIILGPNGAMGRALVREAVETAGINVVAGVGPPGRHYIGADLGLLAGLGREIGVEVSDSVEKVVDDGDVVLECTTPEASAAALDVCLVHGKAFVTGTTGFSSEQIQALHRAGESISVVHAANGSPVVHLLYDLLRIVTRELGKDADIDIVEVHGRNKPDAPSGTAQEIAHIISEELGYKLEEVAEYGRRGMGARSSDSIQFNSLRSGGTPSTHQVIFGFPNERLELTHRALDVQAFAGGLIRAVLFVGDKDPGYFTLDDVLSRDTRRYE